MSMATAQASSDAFLQGQGIPVDLRDIESTLLQLWGPAAEMVGGPEPEHPHVTRIALSNLVVERLVPECETLRPVVESVITRYPCRAIILRGSDDPEKRITAEVSAICHLPDPGLPQVCSERILLRAGPNAGKLIAGSRGFGATPGAHMVLFAMTASSLTPILELPSGGDCSYPGLYWHDDLLHVSYYSSHEGKAAIYYAQVRLK